MEGRFRGREEGRGDIKERFLQIIERSSLLETAGKAISGAVTRFYGMLGEPGAKLADLLHGTWLGHPLHPVLTDSAVGSYTVGMVLDAAEMATGKERFGAGADGAILLGAASSAAAAVAGITDWQHTVGSPRKVGLTHAMLNTAALGLYAASLLARKGGSRGTGRSLAAAGYAILTVSAWLGGHLVYTYKIGVNRAPQSGLPKEFTPVVLLDELEEGRMTRVPVDRINVLLLRRDGQVYAIAETCSHLAGPLAEGELSADNVVTCPWHGSRFSLEDGRLVGGPSTHPQPAFDTRIRNRQVEIRYRDPAYPEF